MYFLFDYLSTIYKRVSRMWILADILVYCWLNVDITSYSYVSGGEALKNIIPDSFIWKFYGTKQNLSGNVCIVVSKRRGKKVIFLFILLTNITVPAKNAVAAAKVKLYFFCFLAWFSAQSPSGWGSWLKLAGGPISSTGGPWDEKRCWTGATMEKQIE